MVNKGKTAAGKDLIFFKFFFLSTALVLVRAHLFLFTGDRSVQEA